MIEIFALVGCYAVLDAVYYGLSQFCVIQFPPHSFETSVYIAVRRYNVSSLSYMREKYKYGSNLRHMSVQRGAGFKQACESLSREPLEAVEGVPRKLCREKTRGRAFWEFVQGHQIYEC